MSNYFNAEKLKSVLPSIKSSVDKSLKSGIVYKITCPRCSSCYVGQTRLHLATRIGKHGSAKARVSIHMKSCGHSLSMNDVSILTTCTKSVVQLMTFEALFINQLKSELKSRDEFKRRVLVSLALAFVKISLDLCQVIEAIYVYILKNFTELHQLKLNTEMFYSTFVIILSFASFFTLLEHFSCFFCTKFNKK